MGKPALRSAMNRVVVRSDVIHCLDTGHVKAWGKPYSYLIDSHDQAYERVMELSEDRLLLDFGWARQPSVVYLKNQQPDDKLDGEGQIIDIFFEHDNGMVAGPVIRPGRDCHFEPPSAPVYGKCRQGIARLLVVAVPR